MRYLITITRTDDDGAQRGSMTYALHEDQKSGKFTVSQDVSVEFGDTFFDTVEGVADCDSAVVHLGKVLNGDTEREGTPTEIDGVELAFNYGN